MRRKTARMTRAIALARTATSDARIEIAAILRFTMVAGCGLALVLAERPLPF